MKRSAWLVCALVVIVGCGKGDSGSAKQKEVQLQLLQTKQLQERWDLYLLYTGKQRDLADEAELLKAEMMTSARVTRDVALTQLRLSDERDAAMDAARSKSESTDLIEMRYKTKQAMARLDIEHKAQNELLDLKAKIADRRMKALLEEQKQMADALERGEEPPAIK